MTTFATTIYLLLESSVAMHMWLPVDQPLEVYISQKDCVTAAKDRKLTHYRCQPYNIGRIAATHTD
jgi:hypothetical protein